MLPRAPKLNVTLYISSDMFGEVMLHYVVRTYGLESKAQPLCNQRIA
jgi:hypothetical protein